MTLGVRFLTAVGSVNIFSYATQVDANSGEAFDVYFQLIDKDQHQVSQGFTPGGNRYMPAVGATASVDVKNIDDSKKFSRAATQPFSQDPSIWKMSLLSTDPLSGTVSLKFKLTEGAVVRSVTLLGAIRMDADGTC
jgi:hypothetical protein